MTDQSRRLLTRASARAAGACYSDALLMDLIPPEGLTPRQVAAVDIPARDRHWALCMACGASDRVLRLHAVWCARRRLALVTDPDPRSVVACDIVERYALGNATEEELATASDAAWDAAWDADRYADRYADRTAAFAAANASAFAANAAAFAARVAANAAGDAAAWEEQLRDLVERLEAEA